MRSISYSTPKLFMCTRQNLRTVSVHASILFSHSYNMLHFCLAHSSSSSSSSTFTNPTKSLNLNDIKEEGRGAQASFKAMTAAQKKAEQLGK